MVEPTLIAGGVENEAGRHVLRALAAGTGIGWDGPDRAVFEERFDRHFPALFRLSHYLSGARPVWLDQHLDLVWQWARSWAERPTPEGPSRPRRSAWH